MLQCFLTVNIDSLCVNELFQSIRMKEWADKLIQESNWTLRDSFSLDRRTLRLRCHVHYCSTVNLLHYLQYIDTLFYIIAMHFNVFSVHFCCFCHFNNPYFHTVGLTKVYPIVSRFIAHFIWKHTDVIADATAALFDSTQGRRFQPRQRGKISL